MTRTVEIEHPIPSPLPLMSRTNVIDLAPVPRLLEALGVRLEGGRIIQLGARGCFGIGELLDTYRPRRIVAYELQGGARGSVFDQAAREQHIPEADESFDAVFVYGFGELRPRWGTVLLEIARVLSPRGVLVVQGAGDIAPTNASFRELSILLQRASLSLAMNKTLAATKGHVLIARRVAPQ